MIGAGVLGVCVALRLAEAGVAVTLLEQGRPGLGATRSSLAWLNANNKLPRAYHDLNYAGMRRWAELAASLGGPSWYRPTGNIEWASSRAEQAQLESALLWVMNLADGEHTVLDVAERSGLPFGVIVEAATALERVELLRRERPPRETRSTQR